jgi:four helix bundle protein
MRVHENLEVWKKAIDFIVLIYRFTEDFPKEERFGIVSQIRRAAVNVAAKIADGAARSDRREKLYLINLAQSSTSEVETELVVSNRLGYLTKEDFDMLMSKAEELGRMMYGWTNYINSRE